MKFFTVEKIAKVLPEVRAAIHRQVHDIRVFKFFPGDCPGAEAPDFDDRHWEEFHVGQSWGGYDQIAWFRARLQVPETLRDQKLALRFLVGPRDGGGSTAETQLYVNGFPLQAIDYWHEEAWLPPEMVTGEEISIALRAWSGVYQVPDKRCFRAAQLVCIDPAAEAFYYRADTVLNSIRQLGEHDLRREDLLNLLNQAFLQVDFLQTGSPAFYSSISSAGEFLNHGLEALQVRERKPTITCVGHSHIDMAWLWRSQHTREKARRTFTTILHLMRQYPEFSFLQSSPQLFKFLKQDDPQLYERVREKILDGRWEVAGTWVEMDTNLPGNESLVRQFLLGKRFIKEEFGVDCKILWMPDTFGFSAVLPQLMKKSGFEYFVTTAIHWGKFTRFPYDTFRWRGLDGSEVLVNMMMCPGETIPNLYTYNGRIEPYTSRVGWEHYRHKNINDHLLQSFGWGDGGGGPTKEMIEAGRIMANLPGMPYIRFGKAEPYFEQLAERLQDKSVPVWDGELYLEGARGVYTSQARNKKANRQAEVLYHDAEWLAAVADTLTGERSYPQEVLNEGWEMLLHNQFHDILPGTSIHDVVVDSLADYERAMQIARQSLDTSQQTIEKRIHSTGESIVVFNPNPWARGGVVELPWTIDLLGKTIAAENGIPVPGQVVESQAGAKLILEAPPVPALGYQVFPLVKSQAAGQPLPEELSASFSHMENGFYRLAFNQVGQITSLYDKRRCREVLAPGSVGNVFQVFEDRPVKGEAWNIDLYYQEKIQVVDRLLEAVVEELGPVRATLRFTWCFNECPITQRITLYRRSPRLDFYTELDWRMQQAMLKVAFPVNVRAAYATYNIQFGCLERATHWNTPHDLGHFENPAQKWVDLSEGDYGVALLNDCKHGYDVKDNVMRLTLHRSPTDPDPTADQGFHSFTYSLLPHSGGWRTGGIVPEAYALNDPLRASRLPANPQGDLPPSFAWAESSAENVVVETVKKAEGEEAWIVRVYESHQCRSESSLTFGLPVKEAYECSLLEENQQPVRVDGRRITFSLAPYEIKTFKICFAAG